MSVQWYYGRGSDITGPISGRELSALARSGEIVVTDTIWQDDIEMGVKAGLVKNLFPTAPVVIDAIPTEAVPVVEVAEVAPPVVPPALVPPQRQVPTNGRARAGKGAVIVSQDGKTVKFRMKCTVCGREDSSWKSIQIPRGTHRTSFYCTVCRKKREAEVTGTW